MNGEFFLHTPTHAYLRNLLLMYTYLDILYIYIYIYIDFLFFAV